MQVEANGVTKSVVMQLTKSTKGTHVYSSEKDGVVCRQVYLTKDECPTPAPQTITLLVEFK